MPVAAHEPDWFVEGAAGMTSSVSDMTQWLRLQLNEGKLNGQQLISKSSLDLMIKPPDRSGSNYGMGWYERDDRIYHSGILWTYSAEQVILKNDSIGVVVLFNGGINAFSDYYSFIDGIVKILEDKTPETSTWPEWIYPVAISLVLLSLSALVVRHLLNERRRGLSKSVLKLWVGSVMRLMPVIIILLLPSMVTLLSNRVLSWYRVFLMMPDVIGCFIIFAIVNVAVVANRFVRLRSA